MAITLDITEIKKILPHRFPMLLVDRILRPDPGSGAYEMGSGRKKYYGR